MAHANRIIRARALPPAPEPSALYFVKPAEADRVSLYVTGSAGNAWPVGPAAEAAGDPGDLNLYFENGLA